MIWRSTSALFRGCWIGRGARCRQGRAEIICEAGVAVTVAIKYTLIKQSSRHQLPHKCCKQQTTYKKSSILKQFFGASKSESKDNSIDRLLKKEKTVTKLFLTGKKKKMRPRNILHQNWTFLKNVKT